MRYLIFLVLLVLVIGLWWSSGYWILTHYKGQEIGLIGDMFGAINALFSGLALAGIIVTIYLQQKELTLQRQELTQTREVFQRQKFENTFFNLASRQQEILSAISFQSIIERRHRGELKEKTINEYAGRNFFGFMEQTFRDTYLIFDKFQEEGYDKVDKDYELSKILTLLKINESYMDFINKENNLNDEKEKIIQIDRIIFNVFQEDYAHYFRHLYQILKFIKTNQDAELSVIELKDKDAKKRMKDIIERYKEYVSFLQAQMSTSELFVLFYNSLKFNKMTKLVNEYDFIENLPAEVLLNPSHERFYNVKLKSNSNAYLKVDPGQ